MFANVEMALISAPVIRVETTDIEGREQRFQVLKNRIFARAKHISQHGVGRMTSGMP